MIIIYAVENLLEPQKSNTGLIWENSDLNKHLLPAPDISQTRSFEWPAGEARCQSFSPHAAVRPTACSEILSWIASRSRPESLSALRLGANTADRTLWGPRIFSSCLFSPFCSHPRLKKYSSRGFLFGRILIRNACSVNYDFAYIRAYYFVYSTRVVWPKILSKMDFAVLSFVFVIVKVSREQYRHFAIHHSG